MQFGDERLPVRFWDKVMPEPNSGCWLWTAALDSGGYGSFGAGGGSRRTVRSHVLAYETLVAKIPTTDKPHNLSNRALDVDHLCRVRTCVNPGHLEAVTHKVNVQRGEKANRTHCPQGHEYTPENTILIHRASGSVSRNCRECSYAMSIRYLATNRKLVRKRARDKYRQKRGKR
jgi:hypothetical protein